MKKIFKKFALFLLSFGVLATGCGQDKSTDIDNENIECVDQDVKAIFKDVKDDSFKFTIKTGKNVKFEKVSIFEYNKNGYIFETNKTFVQLTDLKPCTTYWLNIFYNIDGVLFNDDTFYTRTKESPDTPIYFDSVYCAFGKTKYKINTKENIDIKSLNVTLKQDNKISDPLHELEGVFQISDNFDLRKSSLCASIIKDNVLYNIKRDLFDCFDGYNLPNIAISEKLEDNKGFILENYTPIKDESSYVYNFIEAELYCDGIKVREDAYTFKELNNNRFLVDNLEFKKTYRLFLTFEIKHKKTQFTNIIKTEPIDINTLVDIDYEIFTRSNTEILVSPSYRFYNFTLYDDETHEKIKTLQNKEDIFRDLNPTKTYSLVAKINYYNANIQCIKHICPSKCYNMNVVELSRIEMNNIVLKVNKDLSLDHNHRFKTNSIKIIDLEDNKEIYSNDNIDEIINVSSLKEDHKYKLIYTYEYVNDGTTIEVEKEQSFKTISVNKLEPYFKFLYYDYIYSEHEIFYSIDKSFLNSDYKLRLIRVDCYRDNVKLHKRNSYDGSFIYRERNSSGDESKFSLEVSYEITKNDQTIVRKNKRYEVPNKKYSYSGASVYCFETLDGKIQCGLNKADNIQYKLFQFRFYDKDFVKPSKIFNGEDVEFKVQSNGLVKIEAYGRINETDERVFLDFKLEEIGGTIYEI